jgi:hypothetical protein
MKTIFLAALLLTAFCFGKICSKWACRLLAGTARLCSAKELFSRQFALQPLQHFASTHAAVFIPLHAIQRVQFSQASGTAPSLTESA